MNRLANTLLAASIVLAASDAPLSASELTTITTASEVATVEAPQPAASPSEADSTATAAEAAPVFTGRTRYLVDTGPLRVRDQFPLSAGFLAFDPVGAVVLKQGEWQLDLITTVTNTFAVSDVLEKRLNERESRGTLSAAHLREFDEQDGDYGNFVVDGELVRTAFAVRRGVGRKVQLELMVPFLNYSGGFLDSTIEGFHDTFGFDEAGRKGVPRDTFLALVNSRSGSLEITDDPGLVLGDVVVGAKVQIREPNGTRRYHLALDSMVKLPTGDESDLTSSESFDFGTQLIATRYYEQACVHASVGVLALGEWEALGISSQVLPSAMIAYERSLGKAITGLAQFTVARSPFSDLDLAELSETSVQITLGMKKVIFGDNVLFLGITENLQNFDNTQDIGLHLGLTRTF